MNNKKAVSPVIVTSILVVIVLVLAVIFFLFYQGLISEQVLKFGRPIEEACGDILVTGSAAAGSAQEILLSNSGNIPVYRFGVRTITDAEDTLYYTAERESLAPSKTRKYIVSDIPGLGNIGRGDRLELVPILVGIVVEGGEPKTIEDEGGVFRTVQEFPCEKAKFTLIAE